LGSGTLTFAGTNSFTGSLGITNGAISAASSSVLCDPGADLFIEGGTLNLNNAAQTVLSLSGGSGTVNLGSGHTLTVNPTSGSKTYSGTIAGAGSVTKSGAGTLVLAGESTYSGGITISGGRLQVA